MSYLKHRRFVVGASVVALSLGMSAAFAEPVAVVSTPAVKHLDKAADKEKAKADTQVIKLMAQLLDDILSTDGQAGITDALDANDARRTKDDLKAKHEGIDLLIKNFREEWVKRYGDQYNASNHLGILSADKVEESEKDNKHYALVSFDEAGGVPDFQLKFVREKNAGYRLMLPDHVDGEHLVVRLQRALKEANDSKDSWPKGQSVAYSLTSKRLLYALRTQQPREDETKDDKKKK